MESFWGWQWKLLRGSVSFPSKVKEGLRAKKAPFVFDRKRKGSCSFSKKREEVMRGMLLWGKWKLIESLFDGCVDATAGVASFLHELMSF